MQAIGVFFVSMESKEDFSDNDFLIYLEKNIGQGVRKIDVDLGETIDESFGKLPERAKENYFYFELRVTFESSKN